MVKIKGKKYRIISLVLVCAMLLSMLPQNMLTVRAADEAVKVNVPGGGFEMGDMLYSDHKNSDGTITFHERWAFYTAKNCEGINYEASSEGHTGNALKLSRPDTATANSKGVIYRKIAGLTVGATYQVSVWIKADNSTGENEVGLEVGVTSGTKINEKKPMLVNGEWRNATYTFTAGVAADTFQFNITLGTKDYCLIDDVSITEMVASVTSSGTEDTEYYATLQGAIAAAAGGDTITLLKDVNFGADNIALDKAIILDLNGMTLTAASFATFTGTKVVDSSNDKAGLLKVAKDMFVFNTDANNPQMPVYNGTDGYVFADISPQEQIISTKGADIFELVFRPSLGTSTVVNNKLKMEIL